jgi:hypothetical protein
MVYVVAVVYILFLSVLRMLRDRLKFRAYGYLAHVVYFLDSLSYAYFFLKNESKGPVRDLRIVF